MCCRLFWASSLGATSSLPSTPSASCSPSWDSAGLRGSSTPSGTYRLAQWRAAFPSRRAAARWPPLARNPSSFHRKRKRGAPRCYHHLKDAAPRLCLSRSDLLAVFHRSRVTRARPCTENISSFPFCLPCACTLRACVTSVLVLLVVQALLWARTGSARSEGWRRKSSARQASRQVPRVPATPVAELGDNDHAEREQRPASVVSAGASFSCTGVPARQRMMAQHVSPL